MFSFRLAPCLRPHARAVHDHLGRLPRRGQPRRVPRVPRPGLPRGLRRLAGQVQEPVQGPRRQPAPAQLGQRDAQLPAGGRRHRRRGRVPEHRAAVLPELRALRQAADRRGVPAPPRRRAGPQPVAGRLVQRVPRAPGRRRPDLPQRHRRRHRGHPLDQGARPARRHPAAEHRPRREVGEAALRPGATTGCGRSARTSRSRSTCTAAPATPTTGRTRRRCSSTSTRSPSTPSARWCR